MDCNWTSVFMSVHRVFLVKLFIWYNMGTRSQVNEYIDSMLQCSLCMVTYSGEQMYTFHVIFTACVSRYLNECSVLMFVVAPKDPIPLGHFGKKESSPKLTWWRINMMSLCIWHEPDPNSDSFSSGWTGSWCLGLWHRGIWCCLRLQKGHGYPLADGWDVWVCLWGGDDWYQGVSPQTQWIPTRTGMYVQLNECIY